jgi:hypothetical protein
MKVYFLILIFPLFLNIKLEAGDLLIRGSYGMCFHIKKETETNQNIPEEFQQTQKIPGIGQFFNNGNVLNLGLTYRFSNFVATKVFPVINICYENQSINSTNKDVDNIFGNRLNLSTLTVTFGMGIKFKEAEEKSPRLYLNIGPQMNFINGQTNENNLRSEFDYGTSLFLRIMSGIDIPIINSDYGMSISASYDVGSLKRGKVNYYNDSKWIARAKPTGDTFINDDRISIMLGLFFQIL